MTVQGPVKEQQPDGMSHRGAVPGPEATHPPPAICQKLGGGGGRCLASGSGGGGVLSLLKVVVGVVVVAVYFGGFGGHGASVAVGGGGWTLGGGAGGCGRHRGIRGTLGVGGGGRGSRSCGARGVMQRGVMACTHPGHIPRVSACNDWCDDRSCDARTLRTLATQRTGPTSVGWGVHWGRVAPVEE